MSTLPEGVSLYDPADPVALYTVYQGVEHQIVHQTYRTFMLVAADREFSWNDLSGVTDVLIADCEPKYLRKKSGQRVLRWKNPETGKYREPYVTGGGSETSRAYYIEEPS